MTMLWPNHALQRTRHGVAVAIIRPQVPQFHSQHLAIQKHQRIQRLILRARRHPFPEHQPAEKPIHLSHAQLPGMPFPTPDNEPPDPLHIRVLRPQTEPFEPHHLPALIQKPRLRVRHKPTQRRVRW